MRRVRKLVTLPTPTGNQDLREAAAAFDAADDDSGAAGDADIRR